ncbi:hypothetical protein DPMN_075935 [Dreissena polymorpha]|uniref:Uncharacterized protein n=1 Tax=Dreissena polymorpha TaxID=45954 RepID=A0A9D4BMZ2_DREPO|nr:hypothetical protein DPMN_075935 [Dreissena polymorpha]
MSQCFQHMQQKKDNIAREAAKTGLQINLEKTETKAVNKKQQKPKFRYSVDCHSRECSMMTLSVAIWSGHDLSFLKPTCSGLSLLSTSSLSRSKMMLASTLLDLDSNMMPRKFLQSPRSPFFGSFTRCPFSNLLGLFLLTRFSAVRAAASFPWWKSLSLVLLVKLHLV